MRTGRSRGLLWFLMLCLVLTAWLAAGCGRSERWNVLIVTLDTTRADHLGCYGKVTARTPNMDALAVGGTLFENALSTIPITLPSHSTIFTGKYPLAHGVRDNGLFRLPPEQQTLAEILANEGYATGAAIGAFPLTREFGIAQGFDFFEDHITINAEDFRGQRIEAKDGLFFDERQAAQVNDAILPWLRDNAETPFFAWIHYWDPHQPLAPPSPFDQLYSHDLYQGEIAYVDQSLGVILDELERLGVYDRTLVVLTADHGEGLGEHQEDSHSLLNYNTTLHVPLIVQAPGMEGGRRIRQRVGTVDILPTVLDLLGLPKADDLQGRSLAKLLSGSEPDDDRGLYYAETLSPRLSHGWGELRTLFLNEYKLIHGPRSELYDLSDDPREIRDLVDADPQQAAAMTEYLESFLRRYAVADSAAAVHEVDSEARQRLAALGYISGGGEGPETVREELRTDGTPPQDRIRDINLSSRAKLAIDRQNYLAARDLSERLLELDPDNAYYRGLMALSLFGLGQLEKVVELAEESQSLVSQNDGIFLHIARLLFASGQRQRGLDLARRLADERPTAYGRYLLAEMYWALGDDQARLDELRQTLELESSYDLAQLSLGIHLAEIGEVSEAEAVLRQLIADHPLHHRGFFNLGLFMLRHRRWEEGARFLDRALELKPDYCQAHLTRVAMYSDLGEIEAADEAHQALRAVCSDPEILEHAKELTQG